jgi:hypothetical protein
MASVLMQSWHSIIGFESAADALLRVAWSSRRKETNARGGRIEFISNYELKSKSKYVNVHELAFDLFDEMRVADGWEGRGWRGRRRRKFTARWVA